MTHHLLVATAALMLSLAPARPADAAEPSSRPAPARQGAGPRMFDPATVGTYSGTVEAVHAQSKGRRAGEGVHLDLKTADGVLDVHLGPAAYLREQKLELAKGDAIEVTGSKVTVGGKPALIAQTVKTGGATVTLRDARGVPAWSRRGRR